MRIDSDSIPLIVSPPAARAEPLATPRGVSAEAAPGAGPERPGGQFGDLLREALAKVNATQQGADAAVRRVATGEAEHLHEAIIALEKADLTLRLTSQVTQRAIEAYREVSRMQL